MSKTNNSCWDWIAPPQWEDYLCSLYKKIRGPLKEPIFCFYFIVFIYALGGTGAWVAAFTANEISVYYNSLATFSIALTTTTLADAFLKSSRAQKEEPDDTESPPLHSNTDLFSYLCLAIVITGGSIVTLLPGEKYDDCQLFFSSLAFILWWISNYGERHFNGDVTPNRENVAPEAKHTEGKEIGDFNV
jgi:hypothetical protein